MGCGHPDKVADAISDAILDACLAQDPESSVGSETLVKGNQVVLAGEITTKAKLDYERIVRDTFTALATARLRMTLFSIPNRSPSPT